MSSATAFAPPQGAVLVGVDGSRSAGRALDWAVEEAAQEHRPLVLVHAGDEEGCVILDQARQQVAARAPELDVHEVHRHADPRSLLLDLSHGAATIVVGSHGRGPLASLVVGSVGVALTRHAACPVVVHRPGHGPGMVRRGVLVAADARPESAPVLETAYRLADLRRLPLTVLHCLWDVQSLVTGDFDQLSTVDGEAERLALAEALAGLGEKYPGVHVTTAFAHGMPAARVSAASERMDLVVVGGHRGSRVAQMMFGSVPVAVVEHAACPVVVVPVCGSAS